jgi:hypothetical protein
MEADDPPGTYILLTIGKNPVKKMNPNLKVAIMPQSFIIHLGLGGA